MNIVLYNPLPAGITVNRLEVLHGNTEVTCIVARQIDIPPRSTITTRMYLIPEHAGELHITGVRVWLRMTIDSRFIWVVSGVMCILVERILLRV